MLNRSLTIDTGQGFGPGFVMEGDDLNRPKLLDLFCCQGGATRGYQKAGFEVTGVDIDPQPRYCGDHFHQGDAIEFLAEHWQEFDAFAASPPCQRYTKAQRIQKNDHPDLVEPTRTILKLTGKPYVIENVPGSPLIDPVLLCGEMFGLKTYRHRLFEAGNGFEIGPPEHPKHEARSAKMGRKVEPGQYMQVVGNFTGVDLAREVMGMPWANRDGLREAIPPAYTEFIGRQLFSHVAKLNA